MVKIRPAERTDIPRLHELWRDVFEDSDAFLDAYFEKWFDPAAMLVAEDNGRIVSMSTVYRHAALVLGGAGSSDAGDCPCVFAVATDEDARGQGLAMALIRRQIEAEERRGTPCMIIAPAEESLFALYQERFGFEPWFYVNRIFCRPSDGCGVPADGCGHSAGHKALQALTPADYNARRETFLRGCSHLKFTDRQTELEALICAQSGGGLFEIDRRGFLDILCAIERISDSQIRVNELLVPEEDLCNALQQIQAAFPAAEYEIRIPSYVNRYEAALSMRFCSGTYVWESGVPAAMLLDLTGAGVLPAALSGGAYAGFIYD